MKKERRKKKSKDTKPVSAAEAVEESLPTPSPSPSSSRSQPSLPSPLLSPSLSSSLPSPPRPQCLSPSPSRSRSRSSSPRSHSSTSSSERRSGSSPPRSSSEAVVAETEGAGEAKVLYLFFCYVSGPIAYCLYSVDVPDHIPLSTAGACDQTSESNTIYPILEFRVGEYATGMCCVELDSKLYFLGGRYDLDPVEKRKRRQGLKHWDFEVTYPPDVYVLDAAAITANVVDVSARNCPTELLLKGAPMNTGKPYPYVFVAYRKIYVIVGYVRYHGSHFQDTQLSRFEFFDPDLNQWSILPDPPMNVTLTGHAVVDRKVFVATLDNRMFYFNVDTCEWVSFSKHYPYRAFSRRAEFIEDTLYACYYATLAAFGPTSEAEPDAKAKGLFDHMALLPPEMRRLPTTDHSSCFVHLENRIFCSVYTGTLPDPNYPNNEFTTDSERREISLTIFEALRDNYTKFSCDREKTFFRAKFLHSHHFVARSKCDASANTSFLQGCFSVSSSAGRKARLSVEREHYR